MPKREVAVVSDPAILLCHQVSDNAVLTKDINIHKGCGLRSNFLEGGTLFFFVGKRAYHEIVSLDCSICTPVQYALLAASKCISTAHLQTYLVTLSLEYLSCLILGSRSALGISPALYRLSVKAPSSGKYRNALKYEMLFKLSKSTVTQKCGFPAKR